jgi:acetyltransferase-like isoleucine patch superfamily enzyme
MGIAARDRGFVVRKYSLIRAIKMSVRNSLMSARIAFLRLWYRMDIAEGVGISLKANLDTTNPRGIHIGRDSYLAFGVTVLSHDMVRALHFDTYIGSKCFLGAHAIILPGIKIGDSCIIGSGSVVTRDVPSHTMVAGNPAKIIRSGIETVKWGILKDSFADATTAVALNTQTEL